MWLDPTTTLPAATTSALAWSRSEWVEGTLPTWAKIVGPVAAKVSAASGDALPEEMRAMAGPMLGMLQQLGGAMFGAQVGQGLGQLALEVVSGTDIGLPLAPKGVAVLLPANITAFGAGLAVPQDDVRLYVALREAAHHRLYGHVAWLEARLLGAVEEYAGGINVDGVGSRSCSAAWTPATRLPSSRPSSRASSSPRTPPPRPRPWPDWRRCSPWSRAGSTWS